MYAQGFFSKLKQENAKKESTKEEKKEATPLDIARQDSANPFLDTKEIVKDSKGISGIYYSNKVIKTNFAGVGGYTFAKKFLVNYIEKEKGAEIQIKTQHSYEATDLNKLVRTAIFYLDDYDLTMSKKSNIICSFSQDSYNSSYNYTCYHKQTDLQGNEIEPKPYDDHWKNAYFFEVEPGIIFIGEIRSNYKPEELKDKKKYITIVVLYKKEKATEAAKYFNNEAAWNKGLEILNVYNNAEKQKKSDEFVMPQPSTKFKNAPSTEELNKAGQNFLNKYQGGDKLDYIYPFSEWTNIYKPIGNQKLNTLVGRELKAVLVATKNGECRVNLVTVRQDNIYLTGTFNENYGTNPLYIPASSVVNTIECNKARMYKK
jgi:hypothetical protein